MTQKVTPVFGHNDPKIIEVTYCFLEFGSACKKSVCFHLFILELDNFTGPFNS